MTLGIIFCVLMVLWAFKTFRAASDDPPPRRGFMIEFEIAEKARACREGRCSQADYFQFVALRRYGAHSRQYREACERWPA